AAWVKWLRNVTASAQSSSRWGVLMHGCPTTPIVSPRHWSTTISRTFFGRAATSCALPAGAQHAPGERAGVPAVVQHQLAAHHHVVDALGALHAPGLARGPVVGHLVLVDGETREVEDHEVGGQPLAHGAAVVETEDARRLEGHAPHRV